MEFDFLSPIDHEIIQYINGLSSQHLGSKVAFHTEKDFPDTDKVKIAVIGVLENRGDLKAFEEVNLNATASTSTNAVKVCISNILRIVHAPAIYYTHVVLCLCISV